MKIIADDATKCVLGQGLEFLLDEESRKAAIVMLELGPHLSAHSGLNKVLEIAPNGQPVLMMPWEDEASLASDIRWQTAMAYGNVHFGRLPASLKEIAEALTYAKRIEDPLAKELAKVPSLCNTELSGIVHDLNHALHDGSGAPALWDSKWMPRAKALFGDLLREELIEAVMNANDPDKSVGYFSGRDFSEQVCVDVEGTILDAELQIREDVLVQVKELAKTRPITIWTGTKIDKVEPLLRKAGITYKILPKALFKGAKVGIVIDDLAQEEFDRIYAVNYNEYRRV